MSLRDFYIGDWVRRKACLMNLLTPHPFTIGKVLDTHNDFLDLELYSIFSIDEYISTIYNTHKSLWVLTSPPRVLAIDTRKQNSESFC